METVIVYSGYIGIMEKKMETTVVFSGYTGIMERKMETAVKGGVREWENNPCTVPFTAPHIPCPTALRPLSGSKKL